MSTLQRPASRHPHVRLSRATLFFTGIALFDVLIWTAAALIKETGQPDWTTNEIPFGLAAEIIGLPLSVARGAGDVAVIDLDCSPAVGANQDCSLLLGAMPVAAEAPRTGPQTTVRFIVQGAVPGDYPARLRVDSVDSLLVDATTSPPTYDPSQVITIT